MPDTKSNSGSPAPRPQNEGVGLFDLLWLSLLDIPKIMRTLKFAVWVLIIIAVFSLIGAILPQEHLSHDLKSFAQQYANLFHVDPDDGRMTIGEILYHRIIVPLELYNIFHSGLYFVLLALLAISSSLCAWDRLWISRKLLKLTKPKVKPESIKALKYSIDGVVGVDIEQASKLVRKFLKRSRFEVFDKSDDTGTSWFFVRKNAFRHMASVIFHLAFVLILIGGIIGNERVLGYNGNISLGEGESKPVGSEDHRIRLATETGEAYVPESDELIQLIEYENIYREGFYSGIDPETGFPLEYRGMPSDFVSHLRIIRPNPDGDDEILAEQAIEVNYPLRYGGVAYYQSDVNTLLHFTVSIPGEEPVHIERLQNQSFRIPGFELECTVESWDIAGGIWETLDGTRTELPYVVRLVDYSMYESGYSDHPILLGYLTEDNYLSIDDVTITLDGVDEYTILSYRHDPGVPIVYIGGFLLILGLTIVLYLPYRTGRIMLSPEENGTMYVIGGSWSEFPVLVEKILKSKELE